MTKIVFSLLHPQAQSAILSKVVEKKSDMPNATRQLLRQIERFCARHETSATAFGRAAMGDPTFVHKLRSGRSPRLDTAAKVQTYMEREDAALLTE